MTGPNPLSRSAVDRLVSLVGATIVAVALWSSAAGIPGWALWVAAVAIAAWVAFTLVPTRTPVWISLALLGVIVTAGSVVAGPTYAVGLLPAVITLAAAVGTPAIPLGVGSAFAAASAVILSVGAVLGTPLPEFVICLVAVAVGVLIGVARRQTRCAVERERRTAVELLEAQRRLARSAALDERARIARGLHDVLAHTLGGLVVQLDALEALAEEGRLHDVVDRARSARELAADGLRDARAAVEVLTETHDVDLGVLSDQIRALIGTEQAIGTPVRAQIATLTRTTTTAVVAAFREAARESITNARKHSPGQLLWLTLGERNGFVTLKVTNVRATNRDQPTAGLAVSGTGRGLRGMQARFAKLPDGRVDVTVTGDRFEITAEARRA